MGQVVVVCGIIGTQNIDSMNSNTHLLMHTFEIGEK